MSRRAGKRATFAALLVAGALLIPASQATAGARIASADDGPVATKSGAVVNYTSVKHLKVARHMFIHFQCAVTCNATGIATLKAHKLKLPIKASANGIPAGAPAFMEITVKGALLKALKAHPGRFKVANTITATDPATGAVDQIKHTFKFKR
ncbi:MAG TPA: hypothetical protein VGE91_03345 [Solirubrobacterales bacterium]|jgi:hypothetical protein